MNSVRFYVCTGNLSGTKCHFKTQKPVRSFFSIPDQSQFDSFKKYKFEQTDRIFDKKLDFTVLEFVDIVGTKNELPLFVESENPEKPENVESNNNVSSSIPKNAGNITKLEIKNTNLSIEKCRKW